MREDISSLGFPGELKEAPEAVTSGVISDSYVPF